MSTATLTERDQQFITAIREVVAEAGLNYVYKPPGPEGKCLYVHEGKPSCIIGRALARLGVPLKRLAAKEGVPAHTSMNLHLDGFSGVVVRAANAAQVVQDQRGLWGIALAEFEEVLRNG